MDEDEKTRRAEARGLHQTIDLLGLRAQGTAVGLIQLCAELMRAGVLDDEAVGRIKEAIAKDVIVSRSAARGQDAFEESLRRRLDQIFPRQETAHEAGRKVGTSDAMRDALGETNPDAL